MAIVPRLLSFVPWQFLARAMTRPTNRVYRSDPALVQSCLDGDEKAWAELVRRYGRLVYSIARRYGLGEADSDRVMQNVFSSLMRELKSLRSQDHLSGRLITLTYRETFRQKVGSRQMEPEERPIEETSLSPEDLRRWERQDLIRQAFERLTPREREIVMSILDEPPAGDDGSAARLRLVRDRMGPTHARCLEKLETFFVEMGIDRHL